MKARIIFSIAALLGISAMASAPIGHSLNDNDKGFAVVELFTSEGCSSCPPADELITRIQKESAGKYAEWMNLSSVYTPQAVVNGTKEFIGAEEGTLRNAIQSGLQKAATSEVSVKPVKLSHDKIDLEYHAGGVTADASLLLAVIQKTGVSKVLRGENGGRTLSHVQIVRNLQTINLDHQHDGSASLDIPAGLDAGNLEVIAFIQKNSTGEIIAATKSAVDL